MFVAPCNNSLPADMDYTIEYINANKERIVAALHSEKNNKININLNDLYEEVQRMPNPNVFVDENGQMLNSEFFRLIRTKIIQKLSSIAIFRTIEDVLTSMIIDGINRSIGLKPDFITNSKDTYFPINWTLDCFDSNNEQITDTVYSILIEPYVFRDNDNIYINECSFLPFALLSLIVNHRINKLRNSLLLKDNNQTSDDLSARLMEKLHGRINSKSTTSGNNRVSNSNGKNSLSNTPSSISGGRLLGKGSYGSVWYLERDVELKEMLRLPTNAETEKVNLKVHATSMDSKNYRVFVDKNVFKILINKREFEKEIEALLNTKQLFDSVNDMDILNNNTIFCIHDNKFVSQVELEVECKKTIKRTQNEVKLIQNDRVKLLKDIDKLERRLTMYQDQTHLLHEIEEKKRQLKILETQNKPSNKRKQNSNATKAMQQKYETVTKSCTCIPYKRCDGDIFQKSFSFQEHMKMLENVAAFLRVIHDNNYYHGDIKPGNIFYKNHGNVNHFYVGDYGSISKGISIFTPVYASPYVLEKVYSGDEIHKEHIISFTQQCLPYSYSYGYGERATAVIDLLLKLIQVSWDNDYAKSNNALAKSDLYSLGLTLLESICVSKELNNKQFTTLISIVEDLVFFTDTTINDAKSLHNRII